jgi:hypothetical protein
VAPCGNIHRPPPTPYILLKKRGEIYTRGETKPKPAKEKQEEPKEPKETYN